MWRLSSGTGGDAELVFAKTTDGGANWSVRQYAYDGYENAATELAGDLIYVDNEYLLAFPSTGDYGAAYSGYDTDSEIFLMSSTDFGSSWSEPRVLSAAPNGTGPTEDLPMIACASTAPWHCIVRYYYFSSHRFLSNFIGGVPQGFRRRN